MNCIYCGSLFNPERYEAGYAYCMAKTCVGTALKESQGNYRLVLVPKQGFAYVTSDDPFLKEGGRSSGR